MSSITPSPLLRRAAAGAAVAIVGAGGAAIWNQRHSTRRGTPHTVAPTAAQAPARPVDGKLRIGLRSLNGGNTLKLIPSAAGAVLDKDGRRLAALHGHQPVEVLADFTRGEVVARTAETSVHAPEMTLAGGLLQIGKRRYPGRLHVSLAGAGLQLVDELEIEQYLQGVLPGELPLGYHPEAQKALAVAARTYSLVQRGKHGEYDLCDGTDCQMFVGYRPDARRGLAAVKATRHQCLWDRDQLVYAFYSADCGGVSTRADEVPLKDKPATPLPYLQVVRDAPRHGPDYCARSPYHHWVRRLTKAEVESRLNSRPETFVGKLRDLKVTGEDQSGRVTAVRLRGESQPEFALATLGFTPPPAGTATDKTVTGWELRKALGALTLKSTLLKMDQPEPDTYRFTGSGFGHGLGLCQIGANGMAKQGFTYKQILAHYYPGSRLASLPK